MFPAPEPPELKLSGHYSHLVTEKSAYAHYRPKTRVQCDECLWCLHLNNGRGEYPRSAAFTRTSAGGKIKLCYSHHQLWRYIDGKD